VVIKVNQAFLDKFQAIAEQAGYIIRYERGNFQSGYCILEAKKVLVLNKFLPMEGRINTIMDIIPQLNIDVNLLAETQKKLYLYLTTPTHADSD